MALTPWSTLTTGSSATDANSYNTASITPTADKSVLVAVQARQGAGTPEIPTVSGCGLTWTQVGTYNPPANATNRRNTIFLGIGASPSTGALTIAFNGVTQSHAMWSVHQLNGVAAIVGAAVGTNNASTTTILINLPAFSDAANLAVGILATLALSPHTAGSGFTKESDHFIVENQTSLVVEQKANDTSVDCTFSGTAGINWGMAVEMREDTGGGGNRRRRVLTGAAA
jgi:hypothetical protein